VKCNLANDSENDAEDDAAMECMDPGIMKFIRIISAQKKKRTSHAINIKSLLNYFSGLVLHAR